MNVVERWFSALTTKKLHRSAHVSIKAAALADDITGWVETWNEKSRPFTWQQAAKEILDCLTGSCVAINK